MIPDLSGTMPSGVGFRPATTDTYLCRVRRALPRVLRTGRRSARVSARARFSPGRSRATIVHIKGNHRVLSTRARTSLSTRGSGTTDVPMPCGGACTGMQAARRAPRVAALRSEHLLALHPALLAWGDVLSGERSHMHGARHEDEPVFPIGEVRCNHDRDAREAPGARSTRRCTSFLLDLYLDTFLFKERY